LNVNNRNPVTGYPSVAFCFQQGEFLEISRPDLLASISPAAKQLKRFSGTKTLQQSIIKD
jgi:hypothetical protein